MKCSQREEVTGESRHGRRTWPGAAVSAECVDRLLISSVFLHPSIQAAGPVQCAEGLHPAPA